MTSVTSCTASGFPPTCASSSGRNSSSSAASGTTTRTVAGRAFTSAARDRPEHLRSDPLADVGDDPRLLLAPPVRSGVATTSTRSGRANASNCQDAGIQPHLMADDDRPGLVGSTHRHRVRSAKSPTSSRSPGTASPLPRRRHPARHQAPHRHDRANRAQKRRRRRCGPLLVPRKVKPFHPERPGDSPGPTCPASSSRKARPPRSCPPRRKPGAATNSSAPYPAMQRINVYLVRLRRWPRLGSRAPF